MTWSWPLRSWPLPSIHTWVTAPGMAAVCCSSSAGVPKASRVPETNRHGHLERGQVLDAQALGLARRVERIADQHEAGRRQAVGHRHRADAPAHGATAEHDPVGATAGRVGQEAGLLHHARQELRRPVGRRAPLAPVREVGAAAPAGAPAPPRWRRGWGWLAELPAPGKSRSAPGLAGVAAGVMRRAGSAAPR